MEGERHILLEEIDQLPEQLREEVNMTAVMGMIAVENVARAARGDAEKCYVCEQKAKEYRVNLWEKS